MSLSPILHPERTLAVAVGQAGSKSPRDLVSLAHKIASALPQSAAPSDVALVCADRYYFAAALLGVWLAGHRVALAPNDRPATLEGIHAHTPLLTVLGDGQASALWDVRSCREMQTHGAEAMAFPSQRAALRIYSSGTTGEPAVHVKTFAQLCGEAQLLSQLFDLPGASVLPTVPAHHIYGLLMGVLAPLLGGACFARETPLHAAQIVQAALAQSATLLVASPAHLKGLAVWVSQALHDGPKLSLQRVVSSGAPLPNETAQALREGLGVEVTELFGSTETGGIALRSSPGNGEWAPLPGVKITTAGASGRAAAFLPPLAEDGLLHDQLLVQSPFTGKNDWFVTGDLIQLNQAGTFRHLGRSDSVVKVGGRRVDLGAIERLVALVPGVVDVAVLGLLAAPPRDREIVCALVAPGVSLEEIRHALLKRVDPVALPRRWRFLNAFPLLDNGKLQRSTLTAGFDTEQAAAGLDIACETRSCVKDPAPNTFTFSIWVPPEAWFFRGHFPGNPLMPAVVQVNDVVLPHAARVFGALSCLKEARRLKFKRPILPGDLLNLRLSRPDNPSVLHFALSTADAECSSGVLEFQGAPT